MTKERAFQKKRFYCTKDAGAGDGRTRSNGKTRVLRLCTFFFAVFLVVLSVFSVRPVEGRSSWGDQLRQYELLSVSMAHGHLYLEEAVPDSLKDLEDPYNYGSRMAAQTASGDLYPVDAAYYDGHYYVYFGITPEILLFLPFRLVTGHVLPTFLAMLFVSFLFVCGAFAFAEQFLKKYFPSENSSFIHVFAPLSLIMASGILFLDSFPVTYSMPAAEGLMLLVWGLYFWLRGNILTGSIFLSLLIGCRPQSAAAVLLAFPVFWKEIREGKFFRRTRTAVLNTMKVILPFAVSGAFIFWYNAARFGSPFEFGYRYLLTTTEVAAQKITWKRIGIGLFLELIEPLNIDSTFPFLHGAAWTKDYLSVIYIEPFIAGFFALHPVSLFAFGIFGCGKKKPAGEVLRAEKNMAGPVTGKRRTAEQHTAAAAGFGIVCFFLGFLLVFFDVLSAGISQRYLSDFGIYFMMAALVTILCIFGKNADQAAGKSALETAGNTAGKSALETAGNTAERGTVKTVGRAEIMLRIFLTLLLVFDIAVSLLCLITDGKYLSMESTNPAVYEALRRLFT